MRGTICVTSLIAVAISSCFSSPVSAQADLPDRIAAERTAAIIDRISQESMIDSLANLDYVNNYYYPGYFPQSIPDPPLASVHRILSNRRFLKLYEELHALDEQARFQHLSATYGHYVEQYTRLVNGFRVEARPDLSAYQDLSRVGEVPGRKTFHGTRHALQAIALLSGMLNVKQMWPLLKQGFTAGRTLTTLAPGEHEAQFINVINSYEPVFPDGIRAQVLYQFARHDTKPDGLDAEAILALVPPDRTQNHRLNNYKSIVTPYDMVRRSAGHPIDYSTGHSDINLMTVSDHRLITRIVEAGLRRRVL